MSDEKVQQMEEMIANLERAKMNSWGEKQRLSELYEEERQKNLANPNKIRSVMQVRWLHTGLVHNGDGLCAAVPRCGNAPLLMQWLLWCERCHIRLSKKTTRS